MNKYMKLFKTNMTSKQSALLYYAVCDSYKGEERKLLDEAFDAAFLEAQKRELDYAFSITRNGYVYCAN